IDVPYLKEMQDELGAQMAALESEVEQVAGQKFNLSAPQQLAKVLFEDLRLPVGRRTKTGYSTDADTLEALREKHPIIGLILEHPWSVVGGAGHPHRDRGRGVQDPDRVRRRQPKAAGEDRELRVHLWAGRVRALAAARHHRRCGARVPRPVLVDLLAPEGLPR